MFKKKRSWHVRAVEGTETGGSGTAETGGEQQEKNEKQLHSVDLEKELAEVREKLAEVEKGREAAESEADKWKSMSRKWEDRARGKDGQNDDSEIEKRLAETEAQLKQEQAAKAAAERKTLVLRVAAEEGVAANDQEFLPDTDDEDLLRKHAKRLATKLGPETNNFGGQSGPTRESIIERAKKL